MSAPIAEHEMSVTVEVGLGDRSYPIMIGTGLLGELGERMIALFRGGRASVVTNATVARLFLPAAAGSLRRSGFDVLTIEIPEGEEHKSLETLSFVYDRLLAGGVERGSPVVALGGGVVGDVAGFAAATVLRGLPYVQVPTTLLAQVDSSVGGKTGINHARGKNLIGAFYQPRLVICDVGTLRTLPRRELLAGLAEVIKYGVILDADLFALLEKQLDDVLDMKPALLGHLVKRSCELKAAVVGRDEREAGYRSILNFGHTLGHAIENLTGYHRYLHGEAVAIGMVAAAKISQRRGKCSGEVVERLLRLLRQAGLPVEIPAELADEELRAGIESDKKSEGGRVRFVCVEEIGRVCFERMSAAEIVALCR